MQESKSLLSLSGPSKFSKSGRPRVLLWMALWTLSFQVHSQSLNNSKINGYRGIWFELNQKYEYGDKYAGGLGTYTAKHRPIAVYAPQVEKTFFVYGGTSTRDERHLLSMVGEFDHRTGKVARPTVAWDKLEVNDPHDNPSLAIDKDGYLWVFVSGRARHRKGIKLRSAEPYNINKFDLIAEEEFTYPQVWTGPAGFYHFYTRYTGVRELYFESSQDGVTWTQEIKLAGIPSGSDSRSGHYQLSSISTDRRVLGTFFNRHVNGHPDARTDLYYMQSQDRGVTWTDITGKTLELPVDRVDSPALVNDFHGQGLNVYLKDMDFDREGHPVGLVLTSKGHEPGPGNAPYTWLLVHWNKGTWKSYPVCESDHNYDMGSLYLTDSVWLIMAPTGDPPQAFGVGGEIEIYSSRDQGKTWFLSRTVTHNSPLNHSYIRRPVPYRAPFCGFWASGHPHEFGISRLYFGDLLGNVWELPYQMELPHDNPVKLDKP